MQESGEDYLETILLLKMRQGYVRAIDVANEMEYSKASISRAVKILKEQGLIYLDDNRMINFTEVGRKKAEEIYHRHRLITDYLHEVLGVSEDTAAKDACRIEHVISAETIEKITQAVEKKKFDKAE